ncbi:MAG: phosphate ABC transporter permease subunit PstC [Rhodospirillaceae bacterium]|nr:phosphate ABC transporter permease subunit PstC [Rhodospirillaceae bacterium]
MGYGTILAVLLVLTVVGFYLGRGRARAVAAAGRTRLHSLPGFYGAHVAIWIALPALVLFVFWIAFQSAIVEGIVWNGLPDKVSVLGETRQKEALAPEQKRLLIANITNYATGDIVSGEITALVKQGAARFLRLQALSSWIMAAVMAILAAIGLLVTYRSISPAMRARNRVERAVLILLMVASTVAILTTVGIVLSLLFEAMAFFTKISPVDFLFGLEWSPQTAIREDQVGASGAFGAIPVFAGTMLITVIAMIVAVPVGLFAAIYLSEYASRRLRAAVKPVLEVLAGIPTVVYGFFAALTVAPMIRDAGAAIGLSVASESALAAGLIMGIMIIPFVSSLSDDIINAVPQSLRDGSYGLGATRSETIRQVVLPAALPGIVGAVLLAVSRAIGETMIVVMAAGLSAKLTVNPFDAVTTVTVQIVTNLTGDPEFDSPKTLSAFALGLVLFLVTLCLNVIALRVVQKYREKYD